MAKKNRKIDFRYNLNAYFSFLKKYRHISVFLLIVIIILEAIHVADRYLFKIVIDNGTEFVTGTLMRGALVKILLLVAVVYITLTIFKVAFKWINIHFVNKIETKMIADMKRKYFNHLVHLSHGFHTTHKTGSLISRLTRGTRAVERMGDFIAFNTMPLIFQLVIGLASIIYFDVVSAIVIALTAIAFIVYSLFIQKIQQKSDLEEIEAEDTEKGSIGDIFTNIDSIKYFGKEDVIKKKYEKLSEKTKLASLRHWNYFRWFDSVQSLILAIGTFFLVYFPLVKFLSGGLTLGTIAFIYTVYMTLMSPLFGFVYGMRGFYQSMADFESLFRYGKIENEIKEKPNAEKLVIMDGNIEFKNVSFSYHKKRKLFENFNLKIPKGKKVALVGSSGSGKSTLVKLLYRFYDVEKGDILIDGKDIRDFKQESLRAEMSIVPQECILFDDTIYNNVAFSNPNATEKEVMKAMKFAQLDKFVNTLPKKEKTIVGERGVKLSGGEKQRVSIARAILADKKVLVLDEATSSLDSETEHEIQQDLQELMKGRTSIIIAHRLSTIMSADVIVVLKNGKVVQSGNHKKLIKQKGQYKKLWNLQKGGYIK